MQLHIHHIISRDRAVRQLVGPITRRSLVQIRLPQPSKKPLFVGLFYFLFPIPNTHKSPISTNFLQIPYQKPTNAVLCYIVIIAYLSYLIINITTKSFIVNLQKNGTTCSGLDFHMIQFSQKIEPFQS